MNNHASINISCGVKVSYEHLNTLTESVTGITWAGADWAAIRVSLCMSLSLCAGAAEDGYLVVLVEEQIMSSVRV